MVKRKQARGASAWRTVLLATALCALGSCGDQAEEPRPEVAAEPEPEVVVEREPAVFEVVARGRSFEAGDQISAGWTTIRLSNLSSMTHFAVVERLPEGFTVVEQQELLAPIFQAGMDLLNEGLSEAATEKFGELPAWFGEIVFMGGPGFTGAGVTSEATLYLEPGSYLLECYVKTDGIFHSYNPTPGEYGMVHQFEVLDSETDTPEPEATLEIAVSSEQGFVIRGDPVAGEHVVKVTFEDQQAYANFVGHDIHLVQLEPDTNLEELGVWMDWTQPTGLETPAPAVFLGGTNEMPAGSVTYFRVRLEPGRYAWIAEIPNAADHGMLKVFEVPGND